MNKTPTEAVASNAELGKLYADRDHAAQGEHYMRHIDAMTREGLHAKSAIAGELAHRDIEIDELRKDADRYRWLRDNASCQWDLDYQHIEVVFPLDEEEWLDMDDAVDRAMRASEAGGAA